MKDVKKSITLRLGEAQKNQLNALAKRYEVSQAQIVAVLIHLFSIHGDVTQADAETMLDAIKLG